MKLPISIATVGGILALACGLPPRNSAPQGGPLNGVVIQGCDIDVRPGGRLEAQVYYSELKSPKGTRFDIYVPMGDALEVSNWDASEPAVKLKAGGANRVQLEIDTSANPPKTWLRVTWPDGTEKISKATRASGTYDAIGKFEEPPTVTSVLHPDPEKGRIRISSTTLGLTMSFTLSDT